MSSTNYEAEHHPQDAPPVGSVASITERQHDVSDTTDAPTELTHMTQISSVG